MPKIDEFLGFDVMFYSNEHLPKHVHFNKGVASIKIDIVALTIISAKGVPLRIQNKILNHTKENAYLYIQKCHNHFADKPNLL
jgi:hypothetical protein